MNIKTLYRYFRGDASLNEEKEILEWVDASEENKATFLRERALFDAMLFAGKSGSSRLTRRLRLTAQWGLRVAAAAAVCFAVYMLTDNYLYEQRIHTQSISVPPGQHTQLTLADGTRVWLKAQSTLSYSGDFGRKERNVTLNGEAYFEVTKNKRIPFYVHTEMNTVRVVGTTFDVCAYNNTREFETTLLEGVVDIYPAGENKVITRLQKDEAFSNHNGVYKKSRLTSHEYFRWIDGIYCFDDVPFRELMNKLQRYYNVDISVTDSTLLQYTGCTGKFREQDGVEHILRTLSKDYPFRFKVNETKDSITIYRNKTAI